MTARVKNDSNFELLNCFTNAYLMSDVLILSMDDISHINDAIGHPIFTFRESCGRIALLAHHAVPRGTTAPVQGFTAPGS